METVSSNFVSATVATVESAVLAASQSVTRPPGSQVVLSHVLTNTGNITSSYTIDFASDGTGCAKSTVTLHSLRAFRDVHGSGIADLSLSLATAGALQLLPGQSAVLTVQGTLPLSPSGSACATLTATTALQKVVVANQDTVFIGNTAVLLLTKSASYRSPVVPGQTRIDFTVNATNIGAQSAQPTGTLGLSATQVIVNGVSTELVLIHDVIPAGTQYIAGTLQTTAAHAVRLYRRPGDPAFNFQTTEDRYATEVAVGISAPVTPNASVEMVFAVNVLENQQGDIINVARGYYNDGAAGAVSASNTVIVASSRARLGLAMAASEPIAHYLADGTPDGTATVRFRILMRSYGTAWLYGVQATDLLEGMDAGRFGSYTASAVPAASQYTIAPDSLQAVGGKDLAMNPEFNGTANRQNLLAPGASLAAGAEATVQFDVRFNLGGRATAVSNTARGSAAIVNGEAATIFDDSVSGTNPDPDSDGDPTNNSSITTVATQVPALSLVKIASPPRRTGPGVYQVDYTFRVTNNGSAPAPNIRVVDNLDCAFNMDTADGGVAAWELVGAPKTRSGRLTVSPGFTGHATCDRRKSDSSDAFAVPNELSLSLTDGSHALAAGQSEEITLTAQLTLKSSPGNNRTIVTNKAWAAAYAKNTVAFDLNSVVAATSSSVQSLISDPQGIVYDAATRVPVVGAVVTYARQTCSAGLSGPITPAQLFAGGSGAYVFNANGSVSMTTGADGAYQFFLQTPPVIDLCTYAISVAPPAGSPYVTPSELLPVTPGNFASCGAVAANADAPRGSDSTRYYGLVTAGSRGAAGPSCDVIHNHIALDPGNIRGLLLRMEGSKRQAELGDFMDYALTITNKTGAPITGFDFNDRLPIGFAFIPASAQLNGVRVDNPAGGSGPALGFHFPALQLPADASATVRYRVRIGVGAPTSGDAVNSARVQAGPLQSNQASWAVRISGGVFSDEAFAFGKVYLDCNRDGQQAGSDEIGVPGVRLYMENGTFVITDVEGKWSLYGLKPITHVLRVDQTTLPRGAQLSLLDNRNSGDPASRFVDLVKGEFHKADFAIGNCQDKAVVADVAARRAAIGAHPNSEVEAQLRTRLDPEGKSVAQGDTRGLPASGQMSGGGSTGQLNPATPPLIGLPSRAAGSQAGSFIGAGGSGGTLGLINGGLAEPAGSLFSPLSGMPSTARPATVTDGSATGVGALNSRPVVTSGAMLQPAALPTMPLARPGAIELEAVMPTLADNAPGFIELKDQDTVAGQSINIRVKGEQGAVLRLSVNGEPIDERRVGKKATFADRKLVAWEYIGIALKPGRNLLVLEAIDGFGNARGAAVSIAIVAPDRLGAIQVQVPASARADLQTPVVVRVRLTDAAGVPVTVRTQLTLESDRGRWLDEDLNAREPGVQVFMEGGTAEFRLLPPGEPGNARIRVSTGDFVKETGISFLPELRPMIGVGIVEGVLDLTRRGSLPLGAMPAGAAFETELSRLGGDSSTARASGRAAFFFKGAVQGQYLLTAALDTDKSQKDRLFRDIRPDEFYPVYGDSSVKGFDAQSTQKLYVRIDKDRSYLLYGDFTTASSTEVRSLSQTSRTLTGLKTVYDDQGMRATGYLAHTSQSQQIEEFRALGTSGPYYLSADSGGFVENSEQIEIVVRDRNQPSIVLQRTPVSRFVDYTVESLTRRILFTHPIASVDANLNPQSIRITYEVDSGGEKFIVAGADVQVKATDRLQLGLVASTDRNTANQRDLAAVTALARVGDNTTVAAELVRTQSDQNGQGSGGRVEVRHQDEKLAAVGLANKTSATFDNPGASFSAGRTDVSGRAEYKIDPSLALRGEALYSKDDLLAQSRKGMSLSLQKKLDDNLTVEGGIRHGQANSVLGSSSGFDYGKTSTYNGGQGSNLSASNTTALGAAATASAQGDDLTTVRARVSSRIPGLKGAQAFVEGEQSINEADRHTVAVGANYALTDKTRAYGRYELISNLYGPYEPGSTLTNNTGIVGIESAYMEGGRVYNEYRLADSIDGRSAAAAIGVRNTFAITPRIRLTGGVEHTRSLGAASNSVSNGTGVNSTLGESTAITGGVEYMTDNFKTSGVLEARNGDDANTRLFSAGAGYKVNPEISLLARSVLSDSTGQGASAGNDRQLQRHQFGVAYRPVDTNMWNALARYEHKAEKIVGLGNASGAAIIGGSVFGNSSGNASLPGTYTTDIVSAHLNVNPQRGMQITSRYAVKVSRVDDGILASRYWAQLLQGRLTRDINQDWDIGLQIGLLYGQGGALQNTLGVELGYQFYRNIWVSGGYNFVGLTDRDLTANEYTSKGAYVRMRMKFDETALGFPSAALPAGGGNTAAAAAVVPESRSRQPDAPLLALESTLAPPPTPSPVSTDGR